jgi:hypothetical protein
MNARLERKHRDLLLAASCVAVHRSIESNPLLLALAVALFDIAATYHLSSSVPLTYAPGSQRPRFMLIALGSKNVCSLFHMLRPHPSRITPSLCRKPFSVCVRARPSKGAGTAIGAVGRVELCGGEDAACGATHVSDQDTFCAIPKSQLLPRLCMLE